MLFWMTSSIIIIFVWNQFSVYKHVETSSAILFASYVYSEQIYFARYQVSISSTFLSKNFLYERCFSSFYYVHATRKSCQNDICTKNLYVKHWWNWDLMKLLMNLKLFKLKLLKFTWYKPFDIWDEICSK